MNRPLNNQIPFWLFTTAVFTGLIVPVLIQDGMFMDGVLYTSVAKNLSEGFGTFWFPQFSKHGMAGTDAFHEHPPLVFGIQALFFKLLGPSLYTERIYSLLTALITAWLIAKTWQMVNRGKEGIIRLSWLPVLLWIIIPVGFWSYQNNMHENTMGIFTLLSVYFSLDALYNRKNVLSKLLLSGTFVFLASFSKGVPGFFPVAVIGIYWLVYRKLTVRQLLGYSGIIIGVPVALYGLLMLYEPANESLTTYVEQRLLNRIENAPTVDHRFSILQRLFMELLPPLALSIILIGVSRFKKVRALPGNEFRKKALLFFLIGLSGSAPLMLTLVQKGFYFVPSLPFFGVAFALLVAPGLNSLMGKAETALRANRVLLVLGLAALLTAIGISISKIGDYSRNEEKLHDIYLIGQIVPSSGMIVVPDEMWNEWDLQCYLVRHFTISVTPKIGNRNYFIKEKTLPVKVPAGFKKMPLDTEKYDLYRRI